MIALRAGKMALESKLQRFALFVFQEAVKIDFLQPDVMVAFQKDLGVLAIETLKNKKPYLGWNTPDVLHRLPA